ncbi:MAG: SPFH domain-containing protein [Thermoplasmatota archaeon]
MNGMAEIWWIIVLLFAVFAVAFVAKGIRVIPQAQTRVVERLGKYSKTLHSGVNYMVPGLDKTKKIIWKYVKSDVDGRTLVRYDETDVIDLRETVFDFPAQNVITKDNVPLQMDALIFFQVTEPKRVVYEINNLPDAIEKLTQTSLRSLIGELDLDETLASRDVINHKLTAILDDATDKWGVKVTRVEIQDIRPPVEVIEAMEQQMKAERERRAAILKAEGQKKSAILQAEGEAQSRLMVAKAEADAIETITQAVSKGKQKGDPTGYLIAVKYIETLRDMVSGQDNKVVYIPYEATGILGSLGSIKEMFTGTNKK